MYTVTAVVTKRFSLSQHTEKNAANLFDLSAHRSRAWYVEHDAHFTKRLSSCHRVKDSQTILGHDFDGATTDEEYLLRKVVFTHDVLVAKVVGGLQTARQGADDYRVGATE